MTCLLSTNYQSYNTVIKQWTVFSISKFYLYPVKMERKSLNTPKFTILLSNSQTIDKESDKIKTSVSILSLIFSVFVRLTMRGREGVIFGAEDQYRHPQGVDLVVKRGSMVVIITR